MIFCVIWGCGVLTRLLFFILANQSHSNALILMIQIDKLKTREKYERHFYSTAVAHFHSDGSDQ